MTDRRTRTMLWYASWGFFLLASSRAGAQAPVLTFPVSGDGGSSAQYLRLDLTNGSGLLFDRLTGDPLAQRSRDLKENLFTVIGRPAGQAAITGEIFLGPIHNGDGSVGAALYVETPIGYAAFFDDPGRGVKLGTVRTLAGRPFEAIAAADGNFALLMRRDDSGRTEGTYLYHATSGRGVYLDGLRKYESIVTPEIKPTNPLPQLAGKVTAVEIRAGSEATAAYLVLDPASGEMHWLDLTGIPAQITVRKSPLNLFDVLSREGPSTSSCRFAAIPVDDNRFTVGVFIADAVTGETATVLDVTGGGTPRLVKGRGTLQGLFAAASGGGGSERIFAAVPRVSGSGQTLGAWLVDNQTGGTVYVDQVGIPEAITVTRVAIDRR